MMQANILLANCRPISLYVNFY